MGWIILLEFWCSLSSFNVIVRQREIKNLSSHFHLSLSHNLYHVVNINLPLIISHLKNSLNLTQREICMTPFSSQIQNIVNYQKVRNDEIRDERDVDEGDWWEMLSCEWDDWEKNKWTRHLTISYLITSTIGENEYYERVKLMHEEGGYGSAGYRWLKLRWDEMVDDETDYEIDLEIRWLIMTWLMVRQRKWHHLI